MAQDPKKQQPNDDQPQEDDASLPPWLRNAPVGPSKPAGKEPGAEQPPAKPVIPRLVRRQSGAQEQPDESVPPWLRGLDGPEEKKLKIGGTEVTNDFFDSADELADSQDSDLTFDSWIAEQAEAQREKSVEEEIPDMFAGFDEDESEDKPASTYPMREVTGGTSQLPDWFLGLEALDDKDAPDWVRHLDTGSLISEPEPPPEPPKPDPITDFFREMNVPSSDQDDNYSDLQVPSAGFFSELVGKSPAGWTGSSGFDDEADEDLPDLGSVTGRLGKSDQRRADPPRSEQQLRPKPTGGETRRLDDDEFDLPSASSASQREEPPLRDMGEKRGGQTVRLDDWETRPPRSNQTIRFDDLDDEEPSGTNRLDDSDAADDDDFFAPSSPSSSPAPRQTPRANDTIRFDEDDIFSLQANETIHFDSFDEFEDPPAPPMPSRRRHPGRRRPLPSAWAAWTMIWLKPARPSTSTSSKTPTCRPKKKTSAAA
ncbi:MAG: hypothetical protein IPK19_24815 [Chloroflexi bacterium]|nr:hypothetical protein [Chloroflexota bacterium]